MNFNHEIKLIMSLDPLLHRLIQMTYKSDFAALHTKSLEEVRKLVRTHNAAPQAGYFDTYTLPNQCQLKLFRPDAEPPNRPLPLIFYGRGCGGIAPEPIEARYFCANLAKRLNAFVATPDFRLAPEYKFPIGLYDGLEALKWIYGEADKLNINRQHFVVWGESSGANALTVSCQLLKQENLPIVSHQVLFYPTVDMVNNYPSKKQYQTGYLLEMSFLDWLLSQYLNSPEEKYDFRVSPILNPDLSGLPNTILITAEYDPTRDEAEAYAERLKAAGNHVVHRRYAGMTHGFFVYQKRLKQARAALDFVCEELQKSFNCNQAEPTAIA